MVARRVAIAPTPETCTVEELRYRVSGYQTTSPCSSCLQFFFPRVLSFIDTLPDTSTGIKRAVSSRVFLDG